MEYLQYRCLFYEYASNAFFLMGYPLKLSPTEHELLLLILKHDGLGMDELIRQASHPLSRSSIPVHIHAINRKAKYISDRKLLEFRNNAYRFPIWI